MAEDPEKLMTAEEMALYRLQVGEGFGGEKRENNLTTEEMLIIARAKTGQGNSAPPGRTMLDIAREKASGPQDKSEGIGR